MATKIVEFTKNGSFFPPSPHLQTEIEITYRAKSEISFENGEEEEVSLLELEVSINGRTIDFDWPSYTSSDGQKFHAMMKEAARDALYQQESKRALEGMMTAPQKNFIE